MPTAALTAYLARGNVVSPWRSFVTTELVSLPGLNNRHGHWLCSMSTGRKNDLMSRIHTAESHSPRPSAFRLSGYCCFERCLNRTERTVVVRVAMTYREVTTECHDMPWGCHAVPWRMPRGLPIVTSLGCRRTPHGAIESYLPP